MKGTYHISMCFVCPLPSLTSLPPLRTARACRHFIAATGDMGGRHECRQCIFSGWGQGRAGGRGGGKRNETEVEGFGRRGNYSSLKGITFAPSMSGTRRCSQILSRGYLLTRAASLSVTMSVAIFSFQRARQRKKTPFSDAALLPLYESPWTTAGASLSFYFAFTGHCSQKREEENKK